MIRRRALFRWTPLEHRLVPTGYVEVEPNDVPAAANVVAMPTGDVLTAVPDDWLAIQGTIGSNNDRDYFRFTLNNPAGVFFDLESRDTGLSNVFDSTVSVYDASGFYLQGTNNDGYDFHHFVAPANPVSSALSPDSSMDLNLAAGTYLVRVTSSQSASSGAYQLNLLADQTASVAPPAFSSRPAAPVSLYLDFDGHAASDDWGTYSAAPFDLDGNPATFCPAERLAISNIERVVAEDFASFDVNVTTVAPASIADGKGFRVVITSSTADSIGQPAGSRGAAIFGSFNGPGINTGFVFAPSFGDYLGGSSGLVVATAMEEANEGSRQLGTAMGLRHYGGANSQPNAIMQLPDLGLNRATWSAGLTHSGEPPVVTQDDIASIASPANGIALRPDDYGNDIASAYTLTSNHITGVIGTPMDHDVLRFAGMQGSETFKVSTDAYAGNLDAVVSVYNQAGVLFATADPSDTWDATLTVYLPANGNYYVDVKSHGAAGPVGSYTLDLSFSPIAGPAQVASSVINGGAVQRSMVTDATIRFTRPVFFPNGAPAAFQLTGPTGAVDIDIDLSQSNPSQTIVKLRFPDGAGGFGSLADGKYTLRIVAANAIDDAGNPLDGDGDGQPGGDFVLPFHRLFGDADGNGTINTADFLVFRSAFGGTSAMFDFNNNGSVDTFDFSQFRSRFGSSV